MAVWVWRGGAALLGGALALAACGDDGAGEPDAGDARSASGEVLEGTISDAMIPLEELRSQAPQIRIAPTRSDADAGGDEALADIADDTAETPAPAEPAASDTAAE